MKTRQQNERIELLYVRLHNTNTVNSKLDCVKLDNIQLWILFVFSKADKTTLRISKGSIDRVCKTSRLNKVIDKDRTKL